ncbi:nickel pincer cofactor biosynthesis protein LarC [Winogradskya consettensis]|uniref:Pyridinium-3,5-bisthiocarboxylic acid mononucleotide nickel insertion protein n=1 Tax=Winogradskya consettensis TaxID=113560 RepID=A0A919VQX4_9ACTN|nr:nickel pincer cofactor biosynthesis protein LarC [Actinoplanes consettensis]GIM75399.1 UPF0272 protein Cgl2470/cg2715 [Actinoplanes consettensis]
MSRHAWIDASAGVAGDMLLGALLDAGARLSVVQEAVAAVVGGAVRISGREVRRGGLRAWKAEVEVEDTDPARRTWREIRTLVTGTAHAVFERLAEAEAHVHGVGVDEVHFHEVGALDAIADVVGCCAALEDLGITSVSAGAVAVGSGSVRTRHGVLPVPAPAVAELAKGWQVLAGGDGELATPTGMALLRTWAGTCEPLPPLTLDGVGIGAGGRDPAGRANVVRVLIGTRSSSIAEPAVLLEANVDDLDPRLWPGILSSLLDLGASDAWLVPILMKKGRPAHTLSVLCPPELAEPLTDRIFHDTTTLGVRRSPRDKTALERAFVPVKVGTGHVAVKTGHRDGVLVQVMPEFEDVATLARSQGRPERLVLQEAVAAAAEAGLVVGAPLRYLPH